MRAAVIGGGAAGMLAAYAAARQGAQVTIFEKNEKLGKKLFITGKGRCNLTNDCETEDFFANIPGNGKFLYSALYSFTNRQMVALLEENGCPTKVERGGRVFPASDKSSDVIRTLERILARHHVRICFHAPVEAVWTEDGAVLGVVAGGKRQPFDAVILTSGGASYPRTGSTGDGYRMAQELGHTVTPLHPSLVSMTIREQEVCRRLTGLSLKNVRVTFLEKGKEKFSELGEMLFTHFGVSGPLILSASAHVKDYGFADAKIRIDLKPGLSPQQLDARILRDFSAAQNRQLHNALMGLFPHKLVDEVIAIAGLAPGRAVHDVTREERARLAETTKAFPLTVQGLRGMEEAIITRGGVSVREVNPSTMESRRIAGLFFAGEVLDLDAYTGGFNLQIAFSTGYLAGESCVLRRKKV